jgi:flagellar motor switch protein FliG
MPAAALSGVEKAAILLITLGDRASAEILKHLTDEEVRIIAAAVARMENVPPEQAAPVMEEFQRARANERQARGGVTYVQRLLTAAFGPEGSKKHLENLSQIARSREAGESLNKVDPQRLARLLEKEHPQTVALVLSRVASPQAGALLAALPSALRADAATRLANLDQVSPTVLEKISRALDQKLKALGESKHESCGGLRALAEILNQMDPATSADILTGIGEQDPALMESVRQSMFVFEDLLAIDTNGIKEIIARLDRKLLMTGLKGTSEEMKNHVFQCLSQRGAEMMREDMEALGPIKIKDVEVAQQQIIAVIRQLEADGVIDLKGAGEQQYVL